MKSVIYNEVYAILSSMEPIYIKKIDRLYLEFIKNCMVDSVDIIVNKKLPLVDQGFHDETFDIISDINLTYWADIELQEILTNKYYINEVEDND